MTRIGFAIATMRRQMSNPIVVVIMSSIIFAMLVVSIIAFYLARVRNQRNAQAIPENAVTKNEREEASGGGARVA